MGRICKYCGKENCNKHEFFLGKPIKFSEFSGSTPPEIFVGKWNYPNVYTGILAPQEKGNTQIMSSPELWHKNRMPIQNIMQYRNKLIYGRTQSNIKKLNTKFLGVMKEIAMTHKSVSTEFKLSKPVTPHTEKESRVPLISHAAPVKTVRLEENPKIKKKVEYLVNDDELKSKHAILEMHKSGISTSNIIKILSAGLLGLKKNRRLVPTRWSITATDDTISKTKIEKIKQFPEIQDFQVFHAEYIGNHYEFLLLPDSFAFEVIERRSLPKTKGKWQDHESFFPRKKYAASVTGAYYANRLAVSEYLEIVRRQAQILVIREIRPEYYAPCGVGILREISREAFKQKPRKFNTLNESLADIQTRLRQPVENYVNQSWLLKNFGKQTKLYQFIK